MSGRFSRGLSVVDGSLDVFRARPQLVLLPLCSLLLVGSGFAVAAGLALQYGFVAPIVTNDLVRYGAIFVGFGISTGLGTFFNAAVVHVAARHFAGEDPTVRDGLRAAWEARRTIAIWSVTAATVGTALYVLDEKFGGLGTLARLGFDLAWSLLTFFVVPVLVLEDDESVRAALRRSGETFKDTWGESLTVSFGVGLVMLPAVVAGAIGMGWAFFAPSNPMALLAGAAGFVLVVGAIVFSQVITAVAKTALYQYATEDRRVGPFAELGPRAVLDDD
ncbi:hypothetical protein GCM10028857_05580 [Salinarchaeum chitinilyticum]